MASTQSPTDSAPTSPIFTMGRFFASILITATSVCGSEPSTLAWYSLIHLPPADLDVVLTELRRAMAPEGVLVVGFFDGVEHAPFDHKVTTAYFWPVDEFAAHLERAGFTEIERMQRPGSDEPGHRPHAAIAAIASAPATSSG